MAAGQSKWLNFWWPKITFDRISRHFRSIRKFCFHKMAIINNLEVRFGSPIWKSDLGHFGWPKITFDRFISIRNFNSQNCNKQLLLLFFYNMVVGGHFGWPKITFNRISRHFRSVCFFSQNGCRWPFWMTENHFRSHFSPFQINTQLWFFCSPNVCWRSLWMTKNHFRSHFSPFQINMQLFFHKMAAGGHFGWPKITFDGISRHFRSMHNCLFFSQNGHFGWPKINFDGISRHFRSIHNSFWMTENHRWSYFSPLHINMQLFSQDGCRRPFWMTENHFFRSYFSPFQINM